MNQQLSNLSKKHKILHQQNKNTSASSLCFQNKIYFSSSDPKVQPEQQIAEKKSFFQKVFGKEAYTASKDFNKRWLMILPGFFAHMCIGSPYAWSILAIYVNKQYGFVVPSSQDWTQLQSTLPAQIIFASQGITAAFVGKFLSQYGPRICMTVGAGLFGGGFIIGGLGIYLHSIPILIFGYGILGGAGQGFLYTSPIQSLLKWFPDKKGVALGLTLCGLGSGGIVFTQLIQKLLKHFVVLPQYLGSASQIQTVIKDGIQYININGELKEIVIATKSDLAKLPYDLQEGAYLVGSGNTGAAMALSCMGAAYSLIILTTAFTNKYPHSSFVPKGWNAQAAAKQNKVEILRGNLIPKQVITMPQFYQLFMIVVNVSAGGFAMFAVAKTMMGEVFQNALPTIVDPKFTSNYVILLSLGNLAGRLVWATLSDKIGRRTTFNIFTFGSMPLYFCLPFLVNQVVTTQSALPLYCFMGSTFLIATMLGGTFACLPAYESDLMGSKYVGDIHGKVLLGISISSIGGPQLLLFLKNLKENQSIKELVAKIDEQTFLQTFGSSKELTDQLIQTKTLTISRLMQIAPPGTLDPSPFLYDTALYTMGGLVGLAAIANYTINKIDTKYFDISRRKERNYYKFAIQYAKYLQNKKRGINKQNKDEDQIVEKKQDEKQ